MSQPDVLGDINKDLQKQIERLQEDLEERDQLIAKLPTEEDYTNLQREVSELRTQLNSDELARLKKLAKQGEAYIEIVRNDAKDAFKTKLMSDGVKKQDVNDHPEYLAVCINYDQIDDVTVLYQAAQSHYTSARANRSAGRVSKELNEYTEKVDGTKTNFSRGANDIR